MKLKKLEINGFKSFDQKTSVEFPLGVSAVVGPNGCGKSNIIDALRWVMGEQSVKQLRGKSMEDVIFAGANGKPPLNMAEVSLTLINDNGTAPEELKDFSEIMLTRRLYRSGESAYYINKQLCRLKDIHNVFLGSGLGSKSYAVIQQGNIGAITEAGPEERRFFIEEAAGVTRFINRKNEALRKVLATNQNLIRVTDIISEIKRQMNSLKRQARKAEIYNKYQTLIKIFDIHLAAHYFDEFTQKINETDCLIKDLNDSDIEHSTRLKRLNATVEEIKHRRWQKNQEISDQKNHKYETQRQIDRAENDLAHMRKDTERLGEETVELESARINLEEKNKGIQVEIEQTKNQNSYLSKEITDATARLDQETRDSKNIRDQLAELNKDLESCKADLMDKVAREAQYKNIYQNASNNKDSLKRRLKRADEEEALADRKVNGVRQDEVNAKEELDTVRLEVKNISKQIGDVINELDRKNDVLSRQVKIVQTLEFEKNQARSQFTALKKMEENFDWYKEGVKAIMQMDKSHEAPDDGNDHQTVNRNGIIGLTADIVEPEPSFETAVEAALGDSLQYIIVQEQTDGLRAINYLQANGSGRSGFIPVASIKLIDEDPQKKPDPSRLLLNHVTVKQGFEAIAEALLGHVVLADTFEEALAIFNRNGVRQTVVTKNGDLISCQGIMAGGNKENLSGILAKKQELRELKRKIEQYDKKIESAQDELNKIETDVRNCQSNLQKLTETKNKLSQDEIEAEKAFYKATEDLKYARRHLEIVRLEQEQLLGEESDINEKMEKYHHALSEIENEVEAVQSRITDLTKNIGAVSSSLENFNQRIVDLKLKLTSLNARLENTNNTLNRLEEFREEGIKRLEQLCHEIAQKKQKEADIEQNTVEKSQKLSNMYNDIKLLEEALETNEASYLSIDNELNENDGIISNTQSKREETLQNIRLLEVEQSQQLLKRDNIKDRIEEHYNRPFTELRAANNLDHENIPPEMSIDEMEKELVKFRENISRIIDVNLSAIKEYEELKTRFDFLSEQRDDLLQAVEDLHKVIRKINKITKKRFLETFDLVNQKLGEVFPRLFEGGTAKLVLTDPDKPLETGVEFMIHPPGKKLTQISLLSGGEKALSAISFIFAIFLIKPASFCLMDEIDAPLDEANIYRFNELLKIIGEKSQILMITHNKNTMEFADTLFGVTMENKGVSKIVSVNFKQREALN